MSEYDFFQVSIGTTGPDADEVSYVRSSSGIVNKKPFSQKMSYFGSLSTDAALATDYTRTSLGFASKDNLSDWHAIGKFEQDYDTIDNPFIWGSSIKYVRDDQFIRMGMTKDNGADIAMPKFDVMDTKEVQASGMVAGKNWPSEGWRSFGGKYDFGEYVGGGFTH